MASNVKITETDLVVGITLNWAVYDAQGKLLLKKGAVISSERQIQILITRGTYREATSNELSQNRILEVKQNPFDLFYDFCSSWSIRNCATRVGTCKLATMIRNAEHLPDQDDHIKMPLLWLLNRC